MSGKSYMAGLECWLKGRFGPRWEANILGGSLVQSKKAYKATEDFWQATDDIAGRSVLAKEPLLSKTEFRHGAFYEISTASTRSQRGPHPNNLFADEIDEMPVDVFNAAMNQTMTKNGYPASTALLSTMHKTGGLMSDWVDHAENRGFKLFCFCILEVMEGCYDYSCSRCTLTEWCQGRMKLAMDEAERDQIQSEDIVPGQKAQMGFIPVSDVSRKVKQGSTEENTPAGVQVQAIDVDADLFCKRPSRTGLVYKDFDELVHIVPAQEIHIDSSWPKFRSVDYGYTNPTAVGYYTITSSDQILKYNEYVRVGMTTPELGEYLIEDRKHTKYEATFADPSGANETAILSDMGIEINDKVDNSIETGLNAVRNQLRIRDDGTPGFLMSSDCVYTKFEFGAYSYPKSGISEVPEKKNNHCLDELRYFIVCWQKGYAQSFASLLSGVQVVDRSYHGRRTKAADAFAADKKDKKKAFKGPGKVQRSSNR